MDQTIEQLTIAGYRAEAVPNRFFRQQQMTDHLAIILPGLGYSCDMPALYFTVSHLLSLGADVLQVEYNYAQRPNYRALTNEARYACLLADVRAAWQVGQAQRDYLRVTLVGKSLGTRVLPHLLPILPAMQQARAIRLTPLLRETAISDILLNGATPSLMVIGTADPHYDKAMLAQIAGRLDYEAVIIEGADHGLEIPGDVVQSVRALETIVRAVQSFLT